MVRLIVGGTARPRAVHQAGFTGFGVGRPTFTLAFGSGRAMPVVAGSLVDFGIFAPLGGAFTVCRTMINPS